MEVILLENVRNLGKFASTVRVANGYGRNYLIPQGKAVLATKANKEKFEARRADLETKAAQTLQEAKDRASEINAVHITITVRSADEGKLYGSIGTHEIVQAFEEKGIKIARQEVRLPEGPIREIGDFEIEIQLHAEVTATAKLSVIPEQ
ncbi:MAG TPA: 50S ribosomal protein L9 [Gammaproteobacteria bacterium]|nr:50S ribosomal protein L9 [Gammaproteobacteria bacterium]